MLIYNFQKEFLGIDKKDLEILGFKSLADLQAEVTDFADLFIKTPGYVHNFKHVHWIDFINYADASEEPKVLINVNGKTFKAFLSISTVFLVDNPATPAYIIHLNQLRTLTQTEEISVSNDIVEREIPRSVPEPKTLVETPTKKQEEDIPLDLHEFNDLYEDAPEPIKQKMEQEPKELLQEEDEVTIPREIEQETIEIEEPKLQVEDVTATKPTKAVPDDWDNGYHYDPSLASKELGLPVDLIEEFIEDFIAQAKEFEPQIYNSIEEGDIDTVKSLSHKLKGVAANLRIEDAYETLSKVSATSDMGVAHENLNIFYKIIAKLSGETPQAEEIIQPLDISEKEEQKKEKEEETVDDLKLELLDIDNSIEIAEEDEEPKEEPTIEEDDLKIEPLEIKDDDVPEKINLPELADDNFIPEDNLASKKETFHYSKKEAAQEIGLDQESFDELFQDFIQEANETLQAIHAAVAKNDFHKSQEQALKLQGMSENMRITSLTEEFESLSHIKDQESAAPILEKIDTLLNNLIKEGKN